MTANHTPGPWEYRNASRIYADGVEIAQVAVLSLKQMRANARLMAAAPEMLAILEDILILCREERWPEATTGKQIIYKFAEEAVKQARGES